MVTPFPFGELRPLPIRVRPRPAETTDSFISRLARANHIKPSHLHGILTGPPLSFGKPHLDRLATLAGSSPEILQRTLVNAGSLLLCVKPSPERSPVENAQAQLFFQIQRDAAGRGLTVRTLANRHDVSRRTVQRALAAPQPRPHELVRRRVAATDPIKELINPLIEEGLTIKEVWDRLVDEHDVALSMTATTRYFRTHQLDRTREPHPPSTLKF
ncbi:TniQ family protein [Streptomyces sp. NPDC017254]|uniref:TniQ family protein n=1 Tax=unclassified Streptomyces TaxID=2593676 RepID=UPI00379536F8